MALVVVSALCFGTLGLFGRWAPRVGLDIQSLLGLRFLVAGVVLAGLARMRGEPAWPGPAAARTLAVLGLLYVGQSLCFFGSLRTTPVAVTSVLLYTYPVVVTAVARVVYAEPLSRVRVVAVAVAAVGVVAVVNPVGAGNLDAVGVGLGLGSAVLYSTYILFGAGRLGGIPPLTAGAGVSLCAGVVLTGGAAATGTLSAVQPLGALVIVGIALVATVVAATAFLAGLARIGPSRASILSTLEPVATALLAAVVLGERLGPAQLAGGGLVVAGAVVLATRGGPRAADSPILPAMSETAAEDRVRPERFDYDEDARALAITWGDGAVLPIPYASMRQGCPCAICQGEMGRPGRFQTNPELRPGEDELADIQLVGAYALGAQWADGHNTGIYTFEHLRRLGERAATAGG